MITTKSAEKLVTGLQPPDNTNKPGVITPMETRAAEMKAFATAHAGAANPRPNPRPIQTDQRETRWPMIGSPDSPLAGGTGFIDSSSSDSSNFPRIKPKDASVALSNPPTTVDKRVSEILLAHKAASKVHPDDPVIQPEIERSFSRLSVVRRPPKLDINAVRDAEARGSLTSLPDLIKRATKLATMIDRGKRPGSRLNNLNDFDDIDLAREKEAGGMSSDLCFCSLLTSYLKISVGPLCLACLQHFPLRPWGHLNTKTPLLLGPPLAQEIPSILRGVRRVQNAVAAVVDYLYGFSS